MAGLSESASQYAIDTIADLRQQNYLMALALRQIERVCRNGNPAKDNTALIAKYASEALAKVAP